jgi:hypothetical protein
MASRERTEFIQALLSVDDLRHAEQVLLKSDNNKEPAQSSWVSTAMDFFTWSKGTSEESLEKDARKRTKNISDSDFLSELKGIQDKDLAGPISEAMTLAHSHLSSLINETVKKMAHAVLHMQQEECKRWLGREIKTEEMTTLDDIRVKFIRDVNQNSAGRRTS